MLPPLYAPPPAPLDEEDDDGGPVDDSVLAEVTLAPRTRSKYQNYPFADVITDLYSQVRKYPRYLDSLATHISQPQLPAFTRQFLYDQLHPDGPLSSNDVGLEACPQISGKISVFHSAVATFFPPSDPSGIRGMRRERIRSTPSWHGHSRRDCAFVVEDDTQEGFKGMSAVRVLLFFSFTHQQEEYPYEHQQYPCALVEWFEKVGDSPDPKTGMWIVKPEYRQRRRVISVVHIDSLYRCAHLPPVFGRRPIPRKLHFSHSMDVFEAFYVNKYADHHANEIL